MALAKPLPASAERVRQALAAAAVDAEVVELAAAARTAQQAADALGVEVGQIAKSLIFRAEPSGRAVLVIAAGDRRVDEARIGTLLGESVGRASPQFVREQSGFAIGGVPPLAHTVSMHHLCRRFAAPLRGGVGGGWDSALRVSDHAGRPRPHQRRHGNGDRPVNGRVLLACLPQASVRSRASRSSAARAMLCCARPRLRTCSGPA